MRMNAAYNENERKQVIGDVLGAQNIGADDVLVLGRDGVVFAGPNARRHEELLLFHLSLLVREMFVRVFFVRTFVLDDQLKNITDTMKALNMWEDTLMVLSSDNGTVATHK